MSYAVKQLGYAFGVRDVTFEMPASGVVTIAGPNGAGKSTLLGILSGLRSPYSGSCTYENREIREWPRRKLAEKVAYVPQSIQVEFPFTAEEVVLMGRTPRGGGWFESPDDRSAMQHAMSITDTHTFRARDFRALSGGERQRVVLAAALAQEPRTLLLDEPANHLDLRHQLDLYRLLARLGRGMLVVAVTHDLNLALQFSDRVLLLDQGTVRGDGPPGKVLNPTLIDEVFGVRANLLTGPQGRQFVTYDA